MTRGQYTLYCLKDVFEQIQRFIGVGKFWLVFFLTIFKNLSQLSKRKCPNILGIPCMTDFIPAWKLLPRRQEPISKCWYVDYRELKECIVVPINTLSTRRPFNSIFPPQPFRKWWVWIKFFLDIKDVLLIGLSQNKKI